MKHIPGPWELSPSGQFVRKDTKGDGHLIICEVNRNWYIRKETQIANALRIVACVNAMEGIADPMAFRKRYNESKRGKLILTQEELQKLGEQYRNQEETPYVETSQPKDAPTKADIEELLLFMKKYDQLKEVIENMIDRLDEGSEMTLTKDSIIVLALKGAIK